MIVKTSRFGDKEVPDEALITFPEGVIGFKDATRFVMFECSDDGIFKWLQSCDRPELAFVICEAGVIMPSYKIVIGEKERQVLQLESVDDAVVCLILVIPKNPMDATANLLGPLVMNVETRLGMQVVVVNPQYSTRYRLFTDPNAPKDESGEEPRPESVGEEDGNAGA
ncbi:MAG: flagellar assembly protein FliW [Planctomycetota bacterium]|jgi:flagellar assembly factor FliW|nr:flagellar assembly protein FliW [Planctomycetota bacterium]